METKIPGFSSILAILLLYACFSSRTDATFHSESFQRKLIALHKVLHYINNRPQQMNIDAILGVTLSEANLVAALLHENAQYLETKFFKALEEMVILSDSIRRNLLNVVVPLSETDLFLQSVLNNPSLWVKPVSWTSIYTGTKPVPSQELSYWEIVDSIWHGTPNATESDECLIKIIRSGINGECQIPQTCIETLMRDDGTTGYPLTHRLFMVQVARAFGCRETKSISFFCLIPEYCARILQDLVDMEAWNFPSVSRDLTIEQIVLCGMEGYYEFVDKYYENLILSWPHSSGCFNFFGFPEKHRINRRSSLLTDFGCESHTTGLAAAAFTVFIRENVENALSQFKIFLI